MIGICKQLAAAAGSGTTRAKIISEILELVRLIIDQLKSNCKEFYLNMLSDLFTTVRGASLGTIKQEALETFAVILDLRLFGEDDFTGKLTPAVMLDVFQGELKRSSSKYNARGLSHF